MKTHLAFVTNQPPRRLDTERHSNEQYDGRDHLHCNRNHPPLPLLLAGVCTTHPSAPNTTEVEEDLDITRKKTSQGGRSKLSLIDWDGGFYDTNSKVRKYSADRELDPTRGRELD